MLVKNLCEFEQRVLLLGVGQAEEGAEWRPLVSSQMIGRRKSRTPRSYTS